MDLGTLAFKGHLKCVKRLVDARVHGNQLTPGFRLARAGERQQILHQRLHPPGGVRNKVKMSVGPLGQIAPQIPAQQPAEGDQLPQRLLQVMAGDVGELLQFPIPIRQLSVESPLLAQLVSRALANSVARRCRPMA